MEIAMATEDDDLIYSRCWACLEIWTKPRNMELREPCCSEACRQYYKFLKSKPPTKSQMTQLRSHHNALHSDHA